MFYFLLKESCNRPGWENTNLARFWQTFVHDLASECFNLADFLQESCKICVILQDFCHLARPLQGSNFLARLYFIGCPSSRYFGHRNSHSLQNGKGFNAEKISFLFGVHPVQLNAIPVSIESEPLKNIFFGEMFKIPSKNRWF